MAKPSGNPEIDAILSIAGAKQVNGAQEIVNETKPPETPPATPPITPGTPPVEPIKTVVPDPEAIRSAMLNEMFGEQYKTVEDFKKANIPDALKERDSLRQKVTELTDSLAKKPKHAFASDDIAKFNEFARETGIMDATIFNKLKAGELANMSDIDALSLNHVVANPRLANRSPQEVRDYFETKYDVGVLEEAQRKLEAEEITQDEFNVIKKKVSFSKMEMEADADIARTKLTDLKSKIKMPEVPVEEQTTKKWTPEIEAKQKSDWVKASEKIGEIFSTLPIKFEEGTEPIINFVVPEETKKAILQSALDYVISNQMEINEANMKPVAETMYSQIIVSNLGRIVKSVADTVRSMSKEEYLKKYHNPSPKNSDTPPPIQKPQTAEDRRKAAAEAEMKGM